MVIKPTITPLYVTINNLTVELAISVEPSSSCRSNYCIKNRFKNVGPKFMTNVKIEDEKRIKNYNSK